MYRRHVRMLHVIRVVTSICEQTEYVSQLASTRSSNPTSTRRCSSTDAWGSADDNTWRQRLRQCASPGVGRCASITERRCRPTLICGKWVGTSRCARIHNNFHVLAATQWFALHPTMRFSDNVASAAIVLIPDAREGEERQVMRRERGKGGRCRE